MTAGDALGDAWAAAWASDRVGTMTSIVREHRRSVFASARRVCDDDRAGDVVQEVFLRLWLRPERFDPTLGSLGAYLSMSAHGIAVDLARAEARRRRRDERAAVPVVDPQLERVPVDPAILRRLAVAVSALDPKQRDVVVAAVVAGQHHREIAAAHGIPLGTVKSRVRLGLARLRTQLRDVEQPGGVRGHATGADAAADR